MRLKDHDEGKGHHKPVVEPDETAIEHMHTADALAGNSDDTLESLEREIEREGDEDVDSMGVNDEVPSPCAAAFAEDQPAGDIPLN